jgi:signal recognition particle subunit SRP54
VIENLQKSFQKTIKKLQGQAKLKPSHIEEALGEIKEALLEADVSFSVVTRFLESLKSKALGQKVAESLNPQQQFIYILQKEMREVLGEGEEFNLSFKPPVVVMMVGLQGSGKTTSSAKLALFAKRKLKRQPLLVSVDVRRPAAIDQLERLAAEVKVDSINPNSQDPVTRAREALQYAQTYGSDLVIVDTAGRLSIDRELMGELGELQAALNPQHILYVADAMSGQQGLQVMEGFSAQVKLTGAIVTKADADARGGIVFSIREALKVPLFFVGEGERPADFEFFYADRWVSRILGMGDLKTLIEKAEEVSTDAKAAGAKPEAMAKRAMKGKLTLVDFQQQMKMMGKMGSLKGLMGMIPGMGQMAQQIDSEVIEKKLKRVDAMICSMTPVERERPDVLNGSRKRRITKGSGTSVEELNQFLKEFQQMQNMMKSFKGKKGIPGLGKMFG